MCDKCTELDDKIEHYKRISTYHRPAYAGRDCRIDKTDDGRKGRAPFRAKRVRAPSTLRSTGLAVLVQTTARLAQRNCAGVCFLDHRNPAESPIHWRGMAGNKVTPDTQG
jgi:hypothetical protein